ncbi:MAG TPA: response regulator [Candidatus Wallbacteria bacterium]|nr:response regulator [Candidatus Wallbacteria bacterium]
MDPIETAKYENQYMKELSEIIEVCDKLEVSRSRYKKLFEKQNIDIAKAAAENSKKNGGENAHIITEIKNAMSQRNSVMTILNNIPDIAWLTDEHDKLLAVNNLFAESFGVKPEELINATCSDLWPEDISARFKQEDGEIMQVGKQKTVINQFSDKDSSKIWIEFIKTPIYGEDGAPQGIVGIARDVTEYQKLTAELGREVDKKTAELVDINRLLREEISDRMLIAAELEKAMDAAENSSKKKSEFLNEINFEMRSSMNNIVGFTELLKTAAGEEGREYIKTIERSIECLMKTMNRILEDASKIEHGKVEFSGEKIPELKTAKSNNEVEILAVEDDPTCRRLISTLVSKKGWNISAASNGREAIASVESKHYDIILMDLQMPEINGFETTKAIREIERKTGKHSLIIAITAFDTHDSKQRCFDSGLDGYLPKPFSPKDFYEKIEMYLNECDLHGTNDDKRN